MIKILRSAAFVAACIGLILVLSPIAVSAALKKQDAEAQHVGPIRRAFVVGIDSYEDKGVQKLYRPVKDAEGIAKDLEDVGFDPKNIKLVKNPGSKGDFQKVFGEFLKTVKPGDQVFFFFSGHGFASSDGDVNYLLFSKIKTLLTFAREHLPKDRSGDAAYVQLKARDYEINYEIEEIDKNGLSDQELQDMIAARQPGAAILVLDACRALSLKDDNEGLAFSPTGLHTTKRSQLKPGFAILYSASEKESAIEKLDNLDYRENSLFTDIFRLAMKRPGVDFTTLASQVSDQVKAVAAKKFVQQKPELVSNLTTPFRFIASVGADRYPLPDDADPCALAEKDLASAALAQTVDALVAHLDQYRGCKTEDRAKQRLAEVRGKSVNDARQALDPRDCDDLAASPYDMSRPPSKPGVALNDIGKKLPVAGIVRQPGEPDEFDIVHVIEVCQNAITANPRISRFAYNLARAENARALDVTATIAQRREAMERAKLDYQRLADNGDVLAMNNLAIIYESGMEPWLDVSKRSGIDPKKRVELIKTAAAQGLALAADQLGDMYAHGYPEGGIKADYSEARHWLGLAAKSGISQAVEMEARYELKALARCKIGKWEGLFCDGSNPVLAADLYRRAVRSGSISAMRALGLLYFSGQVKSREQDKDFLDLSSITADSSGKHQADLEAEANKFENLSIPQDDVQALLWFSRAAAKGDAFSNYLVYYMLSTARGVKEPLPGVAARYLRAAAEAGDVDAQVQYVEKILSNAIILRFEDRDETINRLLKQAMKAGDGKAALMLAQLAWPEDTRLTRDASRAAAYAFAAIDLSARVDPSKEIYTNEFNPLTEIAAGHFLVKLGHDPAAVDAKGDPIIHADELATLEKYYGTYDADQKRVVVKIASMPDHAAPDLNTTTRRKDIWIWDWSRSDPPTEMQFRVLELSRGTPYWDWVRDRDNQTKKYSTDDLKKKPDLVSQNMIRNAIAEVYKLSKEYKTSFVALLANKIDVLSNN